MGYVLLGCIELITQVAAMASAGVLFAHCLVSMDVTASDLSLSQSLHRLQSDQTAQRKLAESLAL
jgi:hypothetical protein